MIKNVFYCCNRNPTLKSMNRDRFFCIVFLFNSLTSTVYGFNISKWKLINTHSELGWGIGVQTLQC